MWAAAALDERVEEAVFEALKESFPEGAVEDADVSIGLGREGLSEADDDD